MARCFHVVCSDDICRHPGDIPVDEHHGQPPRDQFFHLTTVAIRGGHKKQSVYRLARQRFQHLDFVGGILVTAGEKQTIAAARQVRFHCIHQIAHES